MTEEEIEAVSKEVSEALVTAGPKGQELAHKMAKLIDGSATIDVVVALNLLKCFLEDTSGVPYLEFNLLMNVVYQFIRNQAPAKGTLQ